MLTLERFVVEKLLEHAAAAARIVGHLGDRRDEVLVDRLADHVDAIVHELGELLGDPHVIAVAAPSEAALLVLDAAAFPAPRAGNGR